MKSSFLISPDYLIDLEYHWIFRRFGTKVLVLQRIVITDSDSDPDWYYGYTEEGEGWFPPGKIKLVLTN